MVPNYWWCRGDFDDIIFVCWIFSTPRYQYFSFTSNTSVLFWISIIFAGILCLQLKEVAITYSLINQFFQLLGFAILGFAFYYVAGIYISIGFDFSKALDIKLKFGVSKFDFNINREFERAEINFNFIPLALIYWIDKIKKKIKLEQGRNSLETQTCRSLLQ